MQRKTGWYVLAALVLSAATVLFARGAQAGSTSVTVTPNSTDATAAVTVTDPGFSGTEVSVVCYAPGVTGAVSDLTANRDAIVYMNQYTVTGTVSFSFQVKKQLVEGEYMLVVTSDRGQAVQRFRFLEEAAASPAATAKPAGNATNAPAATKKPTAVSKKLSAPAGVKAKSTAKKKVTVTWKKVKGAKGYQICTASKKSGKYKVKLTVKGGSKKKATLKGLKSGHVYYVKVNAYKLSGKKKAVGKRSKAVKVKVR